MRIILQTFQFVKPFMYKKMYKMYKNMYKIQQKELKGLENI